MRTGPTLVCRAQYAQMIVLAALLMATAVASANGTRTADGVQTADGPVAALLQALRRAEDRDDANGSGQTERPRRRDWRCAQLATTGDGGVGEPGDLDHGTAVLEATRTVGRYRARPTVRVYVRRRRPVAVDTAVYGTQQKPIAAENNNKYGGPAQAMAIPVIISLPYGVRVSAEQNGRRNGDPQLQEQVRRVLQRVFAAETVTNDESKFPKIQLFDRSSRKTTDNVAYE